MVLKVDDIRELVNEQIQTTLQRLEDEIDEFIRTHPNQCLSGTHIPLSVEPDLAAQKYLIEIYTDAGWDLRKFKRLQQHNDEDWSCYISPLPSPS